MIKQTEYLGLSRAEMEWLEVNERLLPKMNSGKKRLRYVGGSTLLDSINPRFRSHIALGNNCYEKKAHRSE
jgi:hypothetical protein